MWSRWAARLSIFAIWISWQGRRLPVLADRELPTRAGASALDGMRSIAAIVGAGLVAGFLVPGLGGRLFMRLMAATSGSAAQGKLTEAEEVVGEITLGGSVGFVIFVGLILRARPPSRTSCSVTSSRARCSSAD